MKKTFLLAATIIVLTSVKAQTQTKPIVKAIDSITIVGIPVNALVIRGIVVSDSTATVQGALVYIAKGSLGQRGQINFNDVLPILPSTDISVNSLAQLVATKHLVHIKP